IAARISEPPDAREAGVANVHVDHHAGGERADTCRGPQQVRGQRARLQLVDVAGRASLGAPTAGRVQLVVAMRGRQPRDGAPGAATASPASRLTSPSRNSSAASPDSSYARLKPSIACCSRPRSYSRSACVTASRAAADGAVGDDDWPRTGAGSTTNATASAQ